MQCIWTLQERCWYLQPRKGLLAYGTSLRSGCFIRFHAIQGQSMILLLALVCSCIVWFIISLFFLPGIILGLPLKIGGHGNSVGFRPRYKIPRVAYPSWCIQMFNKCISNVKLFNDTDNFILYLESWQGM